MSKQPQRRIRMKLDLGADSWKELHHALAAITFRCSEQQQRDPDGRVDVVSGGCGSSFILDITVDPSQDAEGFQRDLKAYMEATRKDSTNAQ